MARPNEVIPEYARLDKEREGARARSVMHRLEKALRSLQAEVRHNPDADSVFGESNASEYVNTEPGMLLVRAAFGDQQYRTWEQLSYEFRCKHTYLMQVWAVLLEMFHGATQVHVDTAVRRVSEWRAEARNNEYKALY